MRLKIHHALFAGFLGVIGLLVVLTLLLVGSGLSRELEDTFRRELERQLTLGAALVERAGDLAPDSLARLVTGRIDYRVTLIDTTGLVLGESFVEARRVPGIENHRARPEIAGVLEGGERMSFSERRSTTVDVPLLYGAVLTEFDGAPVVLRIAAPRTEIEQAVDRVQRAVAVAGFLAMMVALAAAYLLTKVFARPLVQLADRARQLARGDFSGRVSPGSVSELRDVAIAFNRLSDELRARLTDLAAERDEMQTLIDCMAEGVVALTEDGRLLRTNRTARALLHLPERSAQVPVGAVIRQRALREALEQSLETEAQSREIVYGGRNLLLASRTLDRGGAVTTFLDITELRRLEAVRRDFVANASHELKTPLTSIRGYAETLLDDTQAPEEIRTRFLEAIRANTLRLQHLVDDLLDLSRLESGGWTAGSDRVDVGEVALEAWDLVDAARDKPGMEFGIEGEAVAVADQQGLVQVFRNLFENAVRHTDAEGRVDVVLIPSGAKVVVEVIDDGEGIPARALPRIFERFYRADSSRARDAGGTGLGLAIVKHLVGAMGGEVEAESELGAGTTIRFTLPSG